MWKLLSICTPKPNSIIRVVNKSPFIKTISEFFAVSFAPSLKLEVAIKTPF